MEEATTPELDFSKVRILGLKESLDYLENKCKYSGITQRFNEYVDVPINSEMYDMYGIFYHSFGEVMDDEGRIHDEAIFRNTFDIDESGVYLTL